MQEYDVKRKMQQSLSTENVLRTAREIFGSAELEGERIVASYGALARLECWVDGKRLCVNTESRKDAGDDVARDTIARYNRFLETVTGYTSKERRKRAMKV